MAEQAKSKEQLIEEIQSLYEQLRNFSVDNSRYTATPAINQDPFERVLQRLPVGVGIVINRTIQYANDAAVEMFGYSRQELLGQNTKFLFVNETEYQRIRRIGFPDKANTSTTETRFKRKNGTIFDALLILTIIDVAAPQAGAISTIVDISARKQIEETLQQTLDKIRVAKQEWEATVDTLPDLVCLIDADGRILRANRTVEQWGLGDVTTMHGRAIESLFSADWDAFWKEAWIALGGKQSIKRKIEDKTLNRYFSAQVKPIITETTWRTKLDNSYATILIRDITEKIQAQKALLANKQHLEETLKQLQNTQEQLIQQERLAAVGQLAAGIAHDFNNILTGIIGFAELLKMRPDTPVEVRQKDLNSIVEQGQRAAGLIHQILDFGRKSIRQPRKFELVQFLKDTIYFLRRTIPENIHMSLQADIDRLVVVLDPSQIQQVLTNLVVNARDAMPDGGSLILHLSLTTITNNAPPHTPELSAGEWITLSVSDTGAGIPNEALPHIFEPFFTTKEVGQGSGLGLAQVYGIVKQYSGHIYASSQPEQGSTFTLYLPLPEQRPLASLSEEENSAPLGQGQTILLVEDEKSVLEATQAMLQALNYRVLSATNGQEALQIYQNRQQEIALILSDMMMPDMDGVALFQALRARNPHIKMVMMTGYPLYQKSQEILSQDAVPWINKPMTFRRLAQVIAQTI